MVQSALISITGTQQLEGEESESIQLVTEGSYCYEPGLAIVSYVESEMTGLEGVVTSFTVEDGRTVTAMDVLVPGIGEIVGGSQREERLDLLEARIKDLGMNPEQYKYYLDLRRYGSCKHAGYGLGFERLVMYLTGVSNIRDVLPHPRTVGNADF